MTTFSIFSHSHTFKFTKIYWKVFFYLCFVRFLLNIKPIFGKIDFVFSNSSIHLKSFCLFVLQFFAIFLRFENREVGLFFLYPILSTEEAARQLCVQDKCPLDCPWRLPTWGQGSRIISSAMYKSKWRGELQRTQEPCPGFLKYAVECLITTLLIMKD